MHSGGVDIFLLGAIICRREHVGENHRLEKNVPGASFNVVPIFFLAILVETPTLGCKVAWGWSAWWALPAVN